MQITYKLDEFFYTVFPELKGLKDEVILEKLTSYYAYGPFKPQVVLDLGIITINIDTPTIISQEADYHKTVTLCEKGKFNEAKVILKKLIEQNPTNSEYHRIMGQILSDEGDQEEAINFFIDALRWDSKNTWALIMMGNLFGKFKKDVPTAITYYKQALVAKPDNPIASNNLGETMMELNELSKAKTYFLDALRIDPEYPNSHHGLAMITEREGDFQSAFNSALKAVKFNKNRDLLFRKSISLAVELAKRIIESNVGLALVNEYKFKLELEGGTEIEIVEDANIATAAKIEFAENYNRPKHIVRFKPGYPAVEHLVMHEMVHLALVIEARNEGLNQLFISTEQHKEAFLKTLGTMAVGFRQRGVPDESINQYCTSIL